MTRACSDCGGAVGRTNTTGLCKRCRPKAMAADPAIRASQRAGLRRWIEDPAARAEHIARCIRNGTNLTDEQRAARAERGRTLAPLLRDYAASITPDQRAANGRKRSETVLAWCPPEWRDTYRDLKKRGRRAPVAKQMVLDMIAGRPAPQPYAQQREKLAWCPERYREDYRSLVKTLRAAGARRAVEELIAKDERQRLAALTPHERRLERVRAGAAVITIHPRRRAEPSITLGGVSAGF